MEASTTAGTVPVSERAPIPAVVKRNTALLSLAQMFSGAGTNFLFALGPLMVVALVGSSIFAGISVAMFGISRSVAAYPLGRITDAYGRKPGLVVSLGVALVGTLMIGVSMNAGSFAGFLAGLLVFGMGINGVQQLRLAAAEMFPPDRRAIVIGIVLSTSVVGVAISPTFVAVAQAVAPSVAMDPLALPWFFIPILILPSIALIARVRPDPQRIAADLGRYYPGLRAVEPPAVAGSFGPRAFLADPSRTTAAIAMFAAQGSMQMAMVTAPLVLAHHGSILAAVTLSMALHSASMFAPSIPVAQLMDLLGRRALLFCGALVEAFGGYLVAFSSDHAAVTIGLVCVGLGWCAANVTSSAAVIDTAPTAVRGRAVGMLDTVAAVSGVVFPLLAGVLLDLWGIGSTGIVAMLLMAAPAVAVVVPAHRVRASAWAGGPN